VSFHSLLAVLSFGFVLGLRHATDSDHVVAVTTIVSKGRSVRAAATIGAVWGIGHTLTILIVGGAIVLFRVAVPPRVGLGLELTVALMLIALGLFNLRGNEPHTHAPPAAAGTPNGRRALARSLFVGVVHGLAGSAAVALLVLSTITDPRWALVYIVLFGAGTVAGMMLLTSAIAVPFAVAATRFTRFNARLIQLTAVASLLFGGFIAYRVGVVDGLFTASPHWTPE
jgi:hypothetical protein